MKFRLRTMMILVAAIAVLIAVPTYVVETVLAENRKITNVLLRDLGMTFEKTGDFPQRSTLTFGDLSRRFNLSLHSTSSGTLSNRWGREIQVTPFVIGEIGNKRQLDLTVRSFGPFGTMVCSSTDIFEEEQKSDEKQQERKGVKDVSRTDN